ncbi:protein of unknown function [Legionella fallonii LLAP-10]|uniref:Uncharacterized protein n=1 Tax=Legionella fallonii LLAP-10 TaxID=1212491 RepID=A0A098G367_9GAMM|nr:protein of unknown function [Legionella fallonii LLAP-10]
MENGRRTIGKELAKRIAGIFELDYRVFLENEANNMRIVVSGK